MKVAYADKELKAILNDLGKESDRGAAIIGGSFLEHYLGLAILSRFRELPIKTREILFDGVGPLSSFSAKIHLGFALSLYDEDAYADMRLINRIRNIFAHDTVPTTFLSEEVAQRVKSLKGPNMYFGDERHLTRRKRLREDYINAIFLYLIILKAFPSVIGDPKSAQLPSRAKSRKRSRFQSPRRDGKHTKSRRPPRSSRA
jgi:Mannitol repressor